MQRGNLKVSHDPLFQLGACNSVDCRTAAKRERSVLIARYLTRVRQKNFQAAEDDLVRLRDLSPSEPNVVLLLGQVYRLLGKASMATRMLTVARDLDPKNAPKLEKLLLGGSTRNRPGGPSGPGGAGAVTAATAATAATTAGTGTGTGTGGRSTAAGGDMSVEGPGSSVDESMDASMEGQ
jgi:hypothetical protein